MADKELNIDNEFDVNSGKNLPYHSMTAKGLGNFVTVGSGTSPVFRTRQQMYRFIGHLLKHADKVGLPDEEYPADYEEVIEAINPDSGE